VVEPVVFDRKSATRISRVVKHVERTSLDLSRPNRQGRLAASGDVVVVNNVDTAEIPQFGVIWLYQYDEAITAWTVKRLAYPGVTRLAIACVPIPVGDSALAYAGGVHKVLTSGYGSVADKSRIGGVADSFYAAAHSLGQMLVVGTVAAGEQPSGLAANSGVVLADLQRLRVY